MKLDRTLVSMGVGAVVLSTVFSMIIMGKIDLLKKKATRDRSVLLFFVLGTSVISSFFGGRILKQIGKKIDKRLKG